MVLVIAALAGALLALAAVWIAGAVGRRFPLKESRPVPQAPERSRDDLIDLVGALPLGGLLVGPHDEVMKVNDLGVAMGLVRGTRVGLPGLLDRVRQVRRTDTEYLGTVIQDRPPGMENVGLCTRVIPLRGGRVLVMAEDEAASRRVDAVRRDFVANVSHELKTPIGAIGILAETIEAACWAAISNASRTTPSRWRAVSSTSSLGSSRRARSGQTPEGDRRLNGRRFTLLR